MRERCEEEKFIFHICNQNDNDESPDSNLVATLENALNTRLACVSFIDNYKISLLEQESEELQQGMDSKALSMLWR
jgi:hypothetical protein